ncbi:outer membrane beta-barrel family protein [Flavihumibacter petaseus]|nr:outer membrane beta-barrel family protein [Flavihumibacter petaseus]
MKPILLILLLGLQANLLFSQSSGTLTGFIQDNKQQPLPSATATLKTSDDKRLVKAAVTDKTGRFELSQLQPGSYQLDVTMVGYDTIVHKAITIAAGETTTLQPSILTRSNQSLATVTVTAKKPMIEVKADKTVVNVEAYISNAGSNALEVLEKSPGVTVDRDGNISLKGKQGVIIMIDGKQSYLSGQDLAELLRNTPSNQLEAIELMTQPSAKFDAAGNSGIINIRTKKGRANGFNGTVSLSYVQGVYPKSPNSINLNFKKNKWSMFTALNYSYWEGFNELGINRKFRNSEGGSLSAVFDQHTSGRFHGKNYSARAGADYQLTRKTTIGMQVNGTYNPRTFSANGVADIYDGKGILDSSNYAISTNTDPWKNWGANLNLRTKLDTTGREFSMDLDYINYRSRNEQSSYNYTYYQPGNILADSFLLQGYLPSDINIYSFKADYVHPLGKYGRIEAGVKSSLVHTDNDARYTKWLADEATWVPDRTRSNHFIYDENINAAYVNYNREIKKWSVQAGLRLEQTHAKGKQLANDADFTRDYVQLFPTVFTTYSLNEKNKFNLSYGRRIERPNYQDMNPFQYFLDQYTYRTGNPNLQPQFSHNIELSHNFRSVLNTTLNYTLTTDIINDILVQNDSTKVTYQTKENIARRRNIGIAISYNQQLTKWWTISLFGNAFNNHFTGEVNGLPLDASITSFLGNMNNQFKIGKTWGAELSGFYRSKMQDGGLIIAEPMGVISGGASKQILKGKGTLKLTIADPFYIQRFRGYTQFGSIDTKINARWDNRRVGLTFTYRFGKQQQGSGNNRRRTGTAEEESRVGGGNQQ